jgi:transcriptional regulator with XRE-family HTH domain
MRQMGDGAVLREFGDRLARRRLSRDLTQQQLADRAGVGRRAVQRLEGGQPVTTVALVRILRELEELDALDSAFPEPGPSPLEALRRQGRQRRRASGIHGASEVDVEPAEFRWGDEQ